MKSEFYKKYELFINKLFKTHSNNQLLATWEGSDDNGDKYLSMYIISHSYRYDNDMNERQNHKLIDKKGLSKFIFTKITDDSNYYIKLKLEKNATMIKSWLLNTMKLKPSKEEFVNVYKKVFASLELSDILYMFKGHKNYLFYVLSEDLYKKDKNFSKYDLAYTIAKLKEHAYSKQEIETFIPKLLKGYSKVKKDEYLTPQFIALEDQIYDYLRDVFSFEEIKKLKHYFPNKKIFLEQKFKDDLLFINDEHYNIFLEFNIDYIKTNYNALIQNKDIQEMFSAIEIALKKNLKELGLKNIKNCDIYDACDNPQMNFTFEKNGVMTEEKIKNIILKLIDFYGKEKIINKDFDDNYLSASVRMIALNEKLQEKIPSLNNRRNKI